MREDRVRRNIPYCKLTTLVDLIVVLAAVIFALFGTAAGFFLGPRFGFS